MYTSQTHDISLDTCCPGLLGKINCPIKFVPCHKSTDVVGHNLGKILKNLISWNSRDNKYRETYQYCVKFFERSILNTHTKSFENKTFKCWFSISSQIAHIFIKMFIETHNPIGLYSQKISIESYDPMNNLRSFFFFFNKFEGFFSLWDFIKFEG